MTKSDIWTVGVQDTVPAALMRSAQKTPEAIFLRFGEDFYSYGDVENHATRIAWGLREEGVKRGDTVATLLDNGPDAIFVWMAINKLGAISVPINTAYKGEFLRHQIVNAGAKIVIAEADYADRVLMILDQVPYPLKVYTRGIGSGKALSLDNLRTDETKTIIENIKPGDMSALIFTAGTTGPSKGCMLSHNYMCNLARQALNGAGRQVDETAWTALPLFHLNATATSVVATMILGGQLAVAKRFSVSGFWPDIERSGARIATILGSMITLLAQAKDNDAMLRCKGQLRMVRGAPFPPEMQKIWYDRFGVDWAGSSGYGVTEASLVTSLPYGQDGPPGSSGRANDDFDVRIVNDDDKELPAGEAGEIIVRPKRPHVMFEGYWKNPEATTKQTRNLWFHTGDVGKFDEDGFFYFVDRKKDYLRRRGENISSYELEQTFLEHEAIKEVAVHSVPSEFTEDDVKVTAVLHEGTTLDEETLCRWAVERLPYFAVPAYIEFCKDLPKNPVGRVLKYKLRDAGVTDNTWDLESSSIELNKR